MYQSEARYSALSNRFSFRQLPFLCPFLKHAKRSSFVIFFGDMIDYLIFSGSIIKYIVSLAKFLKLFERKGF